MTRSDFLKGLFGAGAIVLPVNASGQPQPELASKIVKPASAEPVQIYQPEDMARCKSGLYNIRITITPADKSKTEWTLVGEVSHWRLDQKTDAIDVTRHDDVFRRFIASHKTLTFSADFINPTGIMPTGAMER